MIQSRVSEDQIEIGVFNENGLTEDGVTLFKTGSKWTSF